MPQPPKADLRILAALVLYRETLETSSTWNTLKGHAPEYVSWLVLNNGPTSIGLPENFRGTCHEDLGNGGLASAYATALDHARKGHFTHLLLLDQDTRFSQDFWEKQRRAVAQHPDMSLYLPTIYGQRFLLSPCFFRRGLGAPATLQSLPPVLTFKNQSFINSGALFRVSELAAVWNMRITELFLDNIDHAIAHFLALHHKRGVWFRVNSQQAFSGDSRDREQVLKRLKIWVKDARCFGRITGTSLWQQYWIMRRRLGLFWRYRDFRFLG